MDASPPLSTPRSSNSVVWILTTFVIAGILALVGIRYFSSRGIQNEKSASAALKMIAAAEANFRGYDREGNGVQDFWTADVDGLADVALLPVEIGSADPSRPGARPYHGYWFMAMDLDENGNAYRQDTGGRGTAGRQLYNHNKFGFTAYPADYGWSGKHTYRINEGNGIFRANLEGKPLLRWPPDDRSNPQYSASPR